MTASNCQYDSAVFPVYIIKINIAEVFERLCTAVPAVNGKGVAGVVIIYTIFIKINVAVTYIASKKISLCNIGITADDYIIVSSSTVV